MIEPFGTRRLPGWTTAHGIAVVTLLVVVWIAASARAQSGASDTVHGDPAIHRAAHTGDVISLGRELDRGVDPNLTGVGVWPNESAGSEDEALAAVKLMMELGDVATAVDAHGDTALHGAVLRDAKALAVFLLDQGVDLNQVNECGWTPLTIAQGVFYGNLGRRFPDLEGSPARTWRHLALPSRTPGYQAMRYPAGVFVDPRGLEPVRDSIEKVSPVHRTS